MATTMQFVGIPVHDLLDYTTEYQPGDDTAAAAEVLLAALNPIGESFALPWKLKESLSVLGPRRWDDGLFDQPHQVAKIPSAAGWACRV